VSRRILFFEEFAVEAICVEFSLVTSVNCPNSVLPIKQGNVNYNYHVKRSLFITFLHIPLGKFTEIDRLEDVEVQ